MSNTEQSLIKKKLNLSPIMSPSAVVVGGGIGGHTTAADAEDGVSISSYGTQKSTTPLSSRKASKLSTVIGDGSFEAVMKERAKQRKEKDHHIIAELRVSMANMDRSLSQEIKRRIECTTSLETKCTEQIEAMEKRLTALIESRVETLQSQINLVESKVNELNVRLEEEQDRIPKDIEQRGMELQEMLSSFQDEFQMEKSDRLNREGRIMKQMTDQADFMGKEWSQERSIREEKVKTLTENLYQHEKNREDADTNFELLIQTELDSLKERVGRESQERKMEDDEIVDALNRYTDNLQNSLSVLSSVGQ